MKNLTVEHHRNVDGNFGIVVRTTKEANGYIARLRHPTIDGLVSLAVAAPTRDAGCKTAIRFAKKNFLS